MITIGNKETKWGKGNREGRYVAQGDAWDIKVGVLMIGIKGTKWGKRNREDRDN